MTTTDRLPIAPHIEEAAAAWVARRDTGPLDAGEAAEFEKWLSASPAHRAAFERYDGLWSEFDDLSSRPEPRMIPPPEPANDSGGGHLSRRAVGFGMAALIVSATTFAGFQGGVFGTGPMTYQTAIGEQRTETLADNSRITLNTNTRVEVAYSKNQRSIMLDRGEALFEVAHDQSRPFIVNSPNGSVRDVGTKFDVQVSDTGNFDVFVTEGKVVVSPSPTGGTVGSVVSAGERLHTERGRSNVEPISADDMTRWLAWRRGDVIFAGEPLSDAAAEMQRYTPIRITVDPAVAHYSVGGYFRTNDLDAFLQSVQSVFPVRIIRSDGTIRLAARAS